MNIPDPEKNRNKANAEQENRLFDNILAQFCPNGCITTTNDLINSNSNIEKKVIARRLFVLARENKIQVKYIGGAYPGLKKSVNGFGDIGEIHGLLSGNGNYSIKNNNLEHDSGSVEPSSPSKPQPMPLTPEQIRQQNVEDILNGSRNQSPQATVDINERRRALADLLNRPSTLPTPASSNSSRGPQRY